MFSLLGILPILQAVAACFTIWGVAHTSGIADTAVTYGVAGEDGPTASEWFNSFGSIAVGLGGFVVSHVLSGKLGFKSELLLSFIAWVRKPSDIAAERRFGFAVIDQLESILILRCPDEKEWVDHMMALLRSRFAGPNVVSVLTNITPEPEQVSAVLK